jgi:hypothetical protein
MLLSSGGFAIYLAESNIFNYVGPRFGDLKVRANRERMTDAWLQSVLFRATHLNAKQIRSKLLENAKTHGDFLRIVMEEMVRVQRVRRWADNSPEELLHMQRIKREIPDALFIHMIRDGRDVSLSLDARPYPWVRPFSWDRKNSLAVTGVMWEWMVQEGRRQGSQLGSDYLEVHFEALQSHPRGVLAAISSFIDHDLNHERIQKVGIGSVRDPNTSFKGDSTSPVGRWRGKASPEKLALFEAVVGSTLTELNYPLGADLVSRRKYSFAAGRLRSFYRSYLNRKFWFKNSSIGRRYLGPLSAGQIDNIVIAVDPAKHSPQPEFAASKAKSVPSAASFIPPDNNQPRPSAMPRSRS